jgi:hypothetical protein
MTRRIGPIGTATRLLAAAGLLYLAFFDGASWGLEWYDAAVGLVSCQQRQSPSASAPAAMRAARFASPAPPARQQTVYCSSHWV